MAFNQIYINYAIEMQQKYGCLASVLLAQFQWESGGGTSNIANKSNNCFGIKGVGPAGSYISNNGTKWRKYNSKKESFEDYAKLITNARYSSFTKGTKDPATYIQGLINAGYTHDAGYKEHLLGVIKANNLTKYDGKSATTSVTNTETSTTTSSVNSVKDIVDVAITQIGYHEQGGNRTKYGSWYGMNGAAWCHMFVSWCANMAGVSTDIVPKCSYCPDGESWFRSKGRFHAKGSYTPKRGDIIYFNGSRHAGANHVGIVEYAKGSTVYTVEGNTSDKVARRSYALSSSRIRGYGNPAYSSLNLNSGTSSTSSGLPVSNPNGTDSAQKASAEEIAYLKKILKKNASKAKPITNMTVKDKYTVPKCDISLVCVHNKKQVSLEVLDGMTLEWERRGSPGTLKFQAIKLTDKKKIPVEGDQIILTVDGRKMFSGFIFKISRTAQNSYNEYTVYDSLRYFKNKDTMIFKKKRLDEIVKQICKRTSLQCAKLPNTKYKVSAIEDDSEYFEMIQNASDKTLMSKDQIYVLYDNLGTITLKNITDMKVNSCLVDAETGEDYTYESSIDSNVYNQIKLIYENKNKGTYDLYITKDSANINKWGLLQYTEKIQDPTIGKLKAQALLKLYNVKSRKLSINGVIGNNKVRAGSMVPVMLKLEDINVANYMLVEKVTHTFNNREHKMDLVLSGGGFTSE